jgi:hypothetical protein
MGHLVVCSAGGSPNPAWTCTDYSYLVMFRHASVQKNLVELARSPALQH